MILASNKSIAPDSAKSTQAAKEKVVVIIPTYNEASVIQETIHQVFKAMSGMENHDAHILIFDSASTDNTQEIILELQKQYVNLHLKNEPQKSGLGSAYLQAMRYALNELDADIIVEFDADLSHQPKYLRPMLEQLQTCDCVVGSRYVNKGSIPKNWALHRKLFSVLGNYVARTLLTPKYKDFTSGFRATRRNSLMKVLPKQFLTDHYAYKLQLLWLLHKNNAKISEYPIEFLDREAGESKLPKNSLFDALRVVITLRFHEMKQYITMCLVGLLGMIIQFIAYNVLRESLSPFNASQLAVLAAIINNFILNNRFTFKQTGVIQPSLKLKRFTRFMLYSLAMIYLQSAWLWLGVSYFGHGFLQENLILITGIGLISLLNYFTYSRHIWVEHLAS